MADNVFKKFAKKKLGKQLLVTQAILLGLVGTTYIVNAQQYSDKFIEGTYLNGINVGEKTVDEVKELLKPVVENYELTLTFRDGTQEVIGGDAIDFSYTPGGEIQAILEQQNAYSWITGALGSQKSFTIETPVTYDEEKLQALLATFPEFQQENMVSPVNASMQMDENRQYYVVPETMGTTLHTETVLEDIKQGLSELRTELDVDALEDAYEDPTIYTDSENLLEAVADANQYLSTSVTYTDGEGNVLRTLDATVTENWMSQDPETGFFYADTDTLVARTAEYVAQWAGEDDNYGYFRTFKSTNYGNINISTDSLHGHTLNQSQIVTEITQDLINRVGPTSHVVPYSEYEDSLDTMMGGDYVEVDIDAQEVYVYQNYECVFSTSTVTGNEYSTPTPSGIYSIYYRERGATLTGAMKSDGTPSYESYVSYWMAYYKGYGLHDATWRGRFGGSIYTYNGSHGCVNLPSSAARTIWNLTDYGTPVIVFRASNA